ncbi:MAG TPA: thrombospondin type 3 repeat-containing protein, partial [Desulfatiglandales bacterium]|nr:thrombospondin type 3 repeat-containing protein [Desulfatiglandales bacterium]
MKIKSLLVLCMIGIATLCSTNVNAEAKPGAVTLSPFYGGYFFGSDQGLLDSITYGATIGYDFNKNWGIEGSLNYINAEAEVGGADVDSYLYRVEGLYYFMPESRWTPFIALGLGDLDTYDSEFTLDYGLGFKYYISDKIAFRTDIRHVLPFPGNNFIYTAGISFAFGGDKKAAVVKPAPVVQQPVVQAPVVPKDSDGDGVYDDADQCPRTPSGTKVDSKGCPLDSDGDGVYDNQDQCPGTPRGTKVDSKGCPLDSDGDGVYDYQDQCPETPRGTKVDSKGCPLDSDGDGVYDNQDQCPNTPKGANVDQRGCWVLKGVIFDTAKANIDAGDAVILDAVVPILEQNPSLKLEIQGYTDNKG